MERDQARTMYIQSRRYESRSGMIAVRDPELARMIELIKAERAPSSRPAPADPVMARVA